MVAATFTSCSNSNKEANFDKKDVEGFWEGEFIPDPNMKMIFYFWADGAKLEGNSFIVAKDSIAYEDPLHKVKLSGSTIEFDIPTQGMHFEGKINENPLSVKGKSYVPGGQTMELEFAKTQEEKVLHAVEILKRCESMK